jgi:hypothetical protein
MQALMTARANTHRAFGAGAALRALATTTALLALASDADLLHQQLTRQL